MSSGSKGHKNDLARNRRVLVICIGNAYPRDDAVGLVAARCLKTLTPNDATVLEETGEGPALMEAWKDSDTVIILEAVFSGTRPGPFSGG